MIWVDPGRVRPHMIALLANSFLLTLNQFRLYMLAAGHSAIMHSQ